MSEEKKEIKKLKEEDIEKVSGGAKKVDPREDKELNDDELTKVNGGTFSPRDGVTIYTWQEVKNLKEGYPVAIYDSQNGYSMKYLSKLHDFTKEGHARFGVGDIGLSYIEVYEGSRFVVGPVK